MTQHHSSQWIPSAELALLGGQIDELLETSTAQQAALHASHQEPGNSDAYTIGRVIARLTVQRDDLWRIDERLRRWLSEELNDEQRLEVKRLTAQMVRLYDVLDDTLQLASELGRSSTQKPLGQCHGDAKSVAPRKRRAAGQSHDAERP